MIVTKESSKLVEKCLDLIGSPNHTDLQTDLTHILDYIVNIKFDMDNQVCVEKSVQNTGITM